MKGFWPTLLKTACKPLGTAGGNMSCTMRCTMALSSPSTSAEGFSRHGEHGHGGDLVVVLLLPLKPAVACLVFARRGRAVRRRAQTRSFRGLAGKCADGRRCRGKARGSPAHSTASSGPWASSVARNPGGRRRGRHQRNAHLVGESGGMAALVVDLHGVGRLILQPDQRRRQYVLEGD